MPSAARPRVNRYTEEPPVAPSVVKAAGQMWTDQSGLQDFDTPRALELNEIPGVIEEYAQATRNALAAGFDGVELHSASGYLPMQFLSTGTNKRTDAYGGGVTNRIRFVVEALEAMIAAAGSSQRVGIKISPAMPFNDCTDDDPIETYTTLVKAIFGLLGVRSGKVSLRGDAITGLPTHELVGRGMGYVPQRANVFPSLSVEDNLRMGLYLNMRAWAERFEVIGSMSIWATAMRCSS